MPSLIGLVHSARLTDMPAVFSSLSELGPIYSSHRASFPIESITMRLKPFIALIADAEGETYEYRFEATTRRRVKRDVREWCERTDWGATIVAVKPAVVHREEARGHRLVRVAGITFVVSGIAITIAMAIGLRLEGAL